MNQVPLASRMESKIAAAAPRLADDDGIVKPPPANPKVPPPPANNSPLIKAKTPEAAVSADHIAQCPPTPLEARISSSTHSLFLLRSCPPRVCFNFFKSYSLILSFPCWTFFAGSYICTVVWIDAGQNRIWYKKAARSTLSSKSRSIYTLFLVSNAFNILRQSSCMNFLLS